MTTAPPEIPLTVTASPPRRRPTSPRPVTRRFGPPIRRPVLIARRLRTVHPPRRRLRRRARTTIVRPPPVLSLAVTGAAAGLYRVADATMDRYELFVAAGAVPDLTAAAAATSPTLPLAGPALAPATDYYWVAARRNRWGVASFSAPQLVRLAADGSVLPMPPSPPFDVAAAAASTSAVRVAARYAYDADGRNAANQFLVWVRRDGTAPDPLADAPAVRPVVRVDGVAALSFDVLGLTPGQTVKAIVAVGRSGVFNADSEPSAVVTAASVAAVPAAPAAAAFYGAVAGQSPA